MHENSVPVEVDETELMPECFNPNCDHQKTKMIKSNGRGTLLTDYRVVCPICGISGPVAQSASRAAVEYRGVRDTLKTSMRIPSPEAVWVNADIHGWHQPAATFGEDIALIHSEISEALEAFRIGKMHSADGRHNATEELADAIIRICHVAKKHGMDIESAIWQKHNYNITRPFRHGDKAL